MRQNLSLFTFIGLLGFSSIGAADPLDQMHQENPLFAKDWQDTMGSPQGPSTQDWQEDQNSQYEHVTDYKKANPQPPAKPSCVVQVKKTMKVKGVLDGKGCLYVWKGEHQDWCHAPKEKSENAPRMFEMEKGATIKNLQMECSLDGILMNDNTVVENVLNRDCEEDCVTTKGKNNTIRNNQFYLCQDKCIQMNKAENVLIQNNKFFHAARPISGSGAKSGGAKNIRAVGNTCLNCDIMIRAQSKHDIYAKDNVMDKGTCFVETVDQSVVYDEGGNVATRVANYKCADGTKNVKKKY